MGSTAVQYICTVVLVAFVFVLWAVVLLAGVLVVVATAASVGDVPKVRMLPRSNMGKMEERRDDIITSYTGYDG